jgi:hypothetical protein
MDGVTASASSSPDLRLEINTVSTRGCESLFRGIPDFKPFTGELRHISLKIGYAPYCLASPFA